MAYSFSVPSSAALATSSTSNTTISLRSSASTHIATSDSNSMVAPPGLHKFILFPKLPLELRLKIWKEVCFQERVIDLWREFVGGKKGYDFFYDDEYYEEAVVFKSHATKAPAILHTSHEARMAGLKYYSLHFGSESKHHIGNTKITMTTPSRIYVNWDCDTICPFMPSLHHAPNNTMPLERYLDSKCPRLRRLAFCSSQLYNEISWSVILQNAKEIEEVILYPEVDALCEIHEHGFDGSKNVTMQFHSIGEDIEKELTEAGFPDVDKTLLHDFDDEIRLDFPSSRTIWDSVECSDNESADSDRDSESEYTNTKDPLEGGRAFTISFKFLNFTEQDYVRR